MAENFNNAELFLLQERYDRPFVSIEQAIAFASLLEELADEELEDRLEALLD